MPFHEKKDIADALKNTLKILNSSGKILTMLLINNNTILKLMRHIFQTLKFF